MEAPEKIPISALQHMLYCERQCALIHIERVWSENLFTAEGRVMHEKVHGGGAESRRDTRIVSGLRLRSLRLGLTGQADIIEFHRVDAGGVALPNIKGRWQAFPVEYKRGKPKSYRADEVQLCAQAICLEEMIDADIPSGALFYGKTKRRLEVEFDDNLRCLTESLVGRLREMVARGVTPPPEYERRKCSACSLFESCQPEMRKGGVGVDDWLESILRQERT